MNKSVPWTFGLDENAKGLSSSTLKLIAVITMIIDHIGVTIVGRLLYQAGFSLEKGALATGNITLLVIYFVMRVIGRFAFPVYCFFIVEGFFRTKNVKKYATRLFLFALISEVPFDLALFNKPFDLSHQNVYFELFFGLVTIMVIEKYIKPIENKIVKVLTTVGVVAACCVLTNVANMDYGAFGIISIYILYATIENKKKQMILGAISYAIEDFPAPLAFIAIALYNGKRGMSLKYFFYIVYPAQFFILYIIARLMGLGSYMSL